MAEIQYIPIGKLRPHPGNPRKDLGDLNELCESIKGNGILQNLTVVPIACVPELTGREFLEKCEDDDDLYVVVIGHRRLAAATMAGEEDVPCSVVIMPPHQQRETMLIENMQRSDLTYFEQAQGFQMMLDMGHSVQTISNRTGFSETTVRRRLKMAELDPEKLHEVSGRQLSIGDFDELAKVEDLEERNAVLEKIGTSDFSMSLRAALKKQDIKKKMPAVKEWLKNANAKILKQSDVWSSNYDLIGSYIYIAKWGEEGNTPPSAPPKELFYYMDSDSVRFYKKHKRAAPVKKTAEQIAHEKALEESWKALEADSATAYELRKAFIDGLLVTNKNRDVLLKGALWGSVFEAFSYDVRRDYDTLRGEIGLENTAYTGENQEKVAQFLEGMDDKKLPVMVYALFGDRADLKCVESNYHGEFPKYQLKVHMNLLYDWLAFLGYEMSSMEISLMNGSHPSFSEGSDRDEESD